MLHQVLHINITINNVSLKVGLSKIRTILHLSLLLNKSKKDFIFVEIPRFCFHPKLPIAGNCRMCLIELFKAPKLVVACTTRVQEGMIIFTQSVLVKKAREYLLEFFLVNHPLDCPICDQGGECDLQNQLEVFGLDHTRYTENIKKVSKVINIGVVSFQMTRCIQCTRCIRFLTAIASNFDLGMIARGGKMKISKYINTFLYNEFLSNIVDLCPVGSIQYNIFIFFNMKILKKQNFFYFCGALTITNSAYRTRSWELYSKYTIDILDNIGADIRVDLKGTDVIRILPRINHVVNDHWITEITRYSIHGLKIQRLLLPFYKNKNNKYTSTSWATILNIYVKYYNICEHILHKNKKIFGIAGNLIDSKTALSLKYFLQQEGSSIIESRAYQNQEFFLDFFETFSLNADSFKQSCVLFLVGVNLRLEAPFYNLKIKKKKNIIIFTSGCNYAYYSCNGNNTQYQNQIINLGYSLKTLINIIEGKSALSNYIEQHLKTLKGNILFLLGSATCQRKDSLTILNSIKYFSLILQKKIYINCIQPHIGRITANILNLIPGSHTLNNNNTLYLKNKQLLFKNKLHILYNQGAADYQNLQDLTYMFNKLHIYMSHTVSFDLAHSIDLILPTCTFFEKETLYLNIEGVRRESKIVLAPYLNMNVLLDWQIFFLFFKKKFLFLLDKKELSCIYFKKFKFLVNFEKVVYTFLKPHLKIWKDSFFLQWVFFFFKFFSILKNTNNMLKNQFQLKNIIFIIHKNNIFYKKKIQYLLINVYFQKFIYLSVFTKSLFNTLTIDFSLSKQLLMYSRLFMIKNQYSSLQVISGVIAPSIYNNIKLRLINYPLLSKYRCYFDDNLISKNTLDISKIKYNLMLLVSNYDV